MPEWLARHLPEGWTDWHLIVFAAVLGIVMLVGSLLVTAWIIIKLPADHFAGDHPQQMWVDHHPVIRFVLVALKNLLGVALVALGIVLSLPGVPGQGILTILIGLMMIDFPGRRKLERWLLTRRGVLNAVNKIRARFGKPPMYLHAPESEQPSPGPNQDQAPT